MCSGAANDGAGVAAAQSATPVTRVGSVVIPEHVHLRIHRGGARGGLWNQAWREFRDDNRDREVPPAELLAKAFELAYRFDIVGPLVPYSHTLVPPGPQLFAP